MPMVMDCDTCEEAPAISWPIETGLDGFFASIEAAKESALLLDFDGTLAPFRVDPTKVKPWAGVAKLLDEIQAANKTRITIISGRSARDVASQLGMRNTPEIWGLHGAERLWPDGRIEIEDLPRDQRMALDAARSALRETRLLVMQGLRLEEKWNAVVVHWRGKSAHLADIARERVVSLLRPVADEAGLELLLFDGGVELRCGRDKGDAVRMLLAELAPNAPVAYLGDDTTDEDAFEALAGRGLGLLVRRERRPTAAQVWLRPPHELRNFLTRWLRAVRS